MARTPAPPGPPPPHYRPPGSPRPPSASPLPAPQPAGEPSPSTAIAPAAATAVAVITLVIGLVVGFFLGRAYDDDASVATRRTETTGTIPTTTAPTTSRPPGDTIPQQPPGAPPATDLEPDSIGSLDDPVPAGQAYVLGLYEIEVVGATRDATSVLSSFDGTNPAPPDGRQHLLVEVAVRFTDPAGLGSPASIPFFVSDGSGEWFTFDATCGRVPNALADAGLIEQGDEAVGQLCFTVPSDVVDDLALGTESFAGPLYFALP